MKYRNFSNGETIEAHWNDEGDSLLYRRFDASGDLLEAEHFGIGPEEFNELFADFRRVD